MSALFLMKTLGLFIATAIAEIVGCYLPYLWLKEGSELSLICLLVNTSSGGKRTRLRSLRRYLRVNRHSVAANYR